MPTPLPKNNSASPEPKNIQGLILRPFGMAFAKHVVLTIKNKMSTCAFLGELVSGRDDLPQITPGTVWNKKPRTALAMGLTYKAVEVLGLDTDPETGKLSFPKAFREGAVERAPKIGDTGENAPQNWVGDLQDPEKVHILLSVYAQTPKEREDASERLTTTFVQMNAGEVLSTFDAHVFPDGKVHFGYTDGIANPNIKGLTPDSVYLADDQPEARPGEFFLGYPNQFSSPGSPSSYAVPKPETLGMDGSYGAFRVLQQDVKAFNDFLSASETDSGHDANWIAAKVVGRWKNGNPLSLTPDTPNPTKAIPKSEINGFSYVDPGPLDEQGLRCPIGSHIRRTNPRDESVLANDGHKRRLMRRAMPYGPRYKEENEPEGTTRGLVGYFIGGDLEDQFEHVMKVWVNESDFTDGLTAESGDPLLSNNPNNTFNIPVSEDPDEDIVLDVPQFVFTKGSAYCFLPSIPAIQYISQLKD